MNVSCRRVEPEELDGLAADDPRGLRSRRDLRRVHVAMRSIPILRRAVAALHLAAQPRRILELGAGDGTLLLRFARAQRPRWSDVELTLLDRVDLVSQHTLSGYRRLGWRANFLRADALEWAASRQTCGYDLCFANLFLHHFESSALALLLRAVATAADAFVAYEPRRSNVARVASRLVFLLGASEVTRQDAAKSVAAGFAERELSAAWNTAGGDWDLVEFPAPPFSHCLAASRTKSWLRAPAAMECR
jgi:SAM-dependent methyltransferase